jgi:hypothetical protein
MDLESHRRWYDFSRARRHVRRHGYRCIALARRQSHARLNCISHLLSQIPHKKIARKKIVLPDRQKSRGYKEPKYSYRLIPEKY